MQSAQHLLALAGPADLTLGTELTGEVTTESPGVVTLYKILITNFVIKY